MKLLGNAAVPEVIEVLRTQIKGLEDQLLRRFPGALPPPPRVDGGRVEELLCYSRKDGKAVFVLPIDPADWAAAGTEAPSVGASRAMCVVWHFLHGLKLRAEDGNFEPQLGRPAFVAEFGIEDAALLDGFVVKRQGSAVMQFAVAPAPAELQEVLSHETEHV